MLLFYINENGEICSTKERDLVVQTSKGVDTIVVDLPEDYDDTNIIASITFRNAKKIASNSYTMKHIDGSKQLTYLLRHPWFSSVKGTMQFTIRVYSTDTTKDDYVDFDESTGNIIEREESKVQVFTKGSYEVLEAIERGETPSIPTDSIEALYEEINKKASTTYVKDYVEQETGHKFETINGRLETIEQDLQDASDVEAIAQNVYNNNDKVVELKKSDKPLTITSVSNISGDKDVEISLPSNSILVEYGEDFDLPITTIDNALLLNGKKEENLDVKSAKNYINRNGDYVDVEYKFDSAFTNIATNTQTIENVRLSVVDLSNKATTNASNISTINSILNKPYLISAKIQIGGGSSTYNFALDKDERLGLYTMLYGSDGKSFVYLYYNGSNFTITPQNVDGETNSSVTLLSYEVVKIKDLL